VEVNAYKSFSIGGHYDLSAGIAAAGTPLGPEIRIPAGSDFSVFTMRWYAHPDLYHLLSYEVRETGQPVYRGGFPAAGELDVRGLVLNEATLITLVAVPRTAADLTAINATLATAGYDYQTLAIHLNGVLRPMRRALR